MIPTRIRLRSPISQSGWQLSKQLADQISYYAQFPATGVSLRQMVQFGSDPSPGTLFRASQFIVEELPIRLAHRVKDLEALPNGLSDMPSILRVKNWYAQSFEELTSIPQPVLSPELKRMLYKPQKPKDKDHTLHNVNYRANGWQRNDIAIKPESGGEKFSIHPTEEDWTAEGFNRQDAKSNGTLVDSNGGGTATGVMGKLYQYIANSRRYFASVEPDVQWPPEIDQYNYTVTERLEKIKARHDGVVSTVAQGVIEWKNTRPSNPVDYSIQTFLDRFYMSRIGIRMLIGQHVALNNDRGVRPDYVGIICTNTNVQEIAYCAAENARMLCQEWYGLFEAPRVEIVCHPSINFMYVPGHLNHMLFETIKNSLRAVVEHYGEDADEFPPIKVIVAEGQEDITIKISDEGGGIPRREVPFVWTYMYTTVKDTPLMDPDMSRNDFKAPMAGFGYGLPISRLYARYFGGDLKLISMEGYGTDVYLHLNRLSSSSEPLE
ncbi:hypothetical protein TRVA0_042S00474 [Trichomonascus vanleenenianus]|uniref:PDK/BCKDK family protein kinase n=1 Tax=Trichomonascus vanleenenianus TaxID=2268995 RepID=UPI003ECBAE1E